MLTKSSAGVAQIVLPVGFDNSDFAARVEYLGIGLWGNKKASGTIKPRCKGVSDILPGTSVYILVNEFTKSLLTIMDTNNVKGQKIIEAANKLGKVMDTYGERKTAADTIMTLVYKGCYGFKKIHPQELALQAARSQALLAQSAQISEIAANAYDESRRGKFSPEEIREMLASRAD